MCEIFKSAEIVISKSDGIENIDIHTLVVVQSLNSVMINICDYCYLQINSSSHRVVNFIDDFWYIQKIRVIRGRTEGRERG